MPDLFLCEEERESGRRSERDCGNGIDTVDGSLSYYMAHTIHPHMEKCLPPRLPESNGQTRVCVCALGGLAWVGGLGDGRCGLGERHRKMPSQPFMCENERARRVSRRGHHTSTHSSQPPSLRRGHAQGHKGQAVRTPSSAAQRSFRRAQRAEVRGQKEYMAALSRSNSRTNSVVAMSTPFQLSQLQYMKGTSTGGAGSNQHPVMLMNRT